MPKEKEFIKVIPKFYRRNVEDIGLFFFIKAQKQVFPTMTIEQGINNYFRLLDINDDDWGMECARVTYTRMQQEFIELQREDSKTYSRDIGQERSTGGCRS